CRMMRSVPLTKAMDDALIAYGQSGEALRPAQGYPMRLLLPGWEGNTNVKWLHSLKLTDQAYMARDETAKYSDLMPDGKARIFTYRMEAKSVITFPSGGQKLPGTGLYELTGLAWSGSGRIERVEITTDGGKSRLARRLGHGRRRTRSFRGPVRPLSRAEGRRRYWSNPRGRTGHASNAETSQDGGEFLALRDHALGLHQPRDAFRQAGSIKVIGG